MICRSPGDTTVRSVPHQGQDHGVTRMEFQEVRYFLALSQTLNFTKAAEACHVSQPALTRAIRKMEDEFGGLLFSREPNNTHMTELGRLLEPHLIEIMACAGTVKKTATRFLKLEEANFTLGVMCTIAPAQFVPLHRSLQGRQPWNRDHDAGGRAKPTLRTVNYGRNRRRVDVSP